MKEMLYKTGLAHTPWSNERYIPSILHMRAKQFRLLLTVTEKFIGDIAL